LVEGSQFNQTLKESTKKTKCLGFLIKGYLREWSMFDFLIQTFRGPELISYLTASRVIKTMNVGLPMRLCEDLTKHSYFERCRPGRLKCYDGARTKIGRQTLCNRAGFCVNDVDFD